MGFPAALATLEGFKTFMEDAFRKEAGQTVSAEAEATIGCTSVEDAETFKVQAVLTFGKGIYAQRLPVDLELALKSRATADVKHQIALRTLRADFAKVRHEAGANGSDWRAEGAAASDEHANEPARIFWRQSQRSPAG